MSALSDLQAIYASDPSAVAVDVGAGTSRRRCRGFLSTRRGQIVTEDGFGTFAVQTMLRVLVGALGTPTPDTPLAIGGVTYRLIGLEPADGDGSEEIAFLVKG